MEEDLERAVQEEDVEKFRDLVKMISEMESSIEEKTNILGPALLRAVRGPVNNPVMAQFVRALVDAGADCNQIFMCSNTPLILAAERGQTEVTEILLQCGCHVNRTDTETRTALHWACMNGHLDIVKLLLQYDAHPDLKDRIYGFTPLMLASRQGHDQIVETLLNCHIEVNQDDIHKETALFDAVRNGQERCVSLLLQAGSDVNHYDKNRATPILIATYYNRVNIAKMLIQKNCDINIRGCAPYSQLAFLPPDTLIPARQDALEVALLEGKWDMCEVLVLGGINTHKKIKYAIHSEFFENLPIADEKKHMPVWLKEAIVNPRMLKDLARIVIRTCIPSNGFSEITKLLPLPLSLVQYITIPELLPT